MGEGSPPTGDVFDLARVRKLIELMKEHNLSQLDLQQGDQRIALARGGVAEEGATYAAPRAAPSPAPAEGKPAVPAAASENAVYVKSPMVGTFYVRPNPKAEPFIKVGDHVQPSTVVCIVEAMKVFNEIPAEVSGKVVALLVEDGEPVEFGQNLFRLESAK